MKEKVINKIENKNLRYMYQQQNNERNNSGLRYGVVTI